MLKYVCIIALFLLGCAGAMPVTVEELSYQKVLELPGQSKETIYEKSKQWIATNFKSAKAVIEYDSKTDGVIIGNGTIDRPASEVHISGTHHITFLLREDIKDNKARLTFDKPEVFSPAYYNPVSRTTYPPSSSPIRKADVPGMRFTFDEISENLKNYILATEKAW